MLFLGHNLRHKSEHQVKYSFEYKLHLLVFVLVVVLPSKYNTINEQLYEKCHFRLFRPITHYHKKWINHLYDAK